MNNFLFFAILLAKTILFLNRPAVHSQATHPASLQNKLRVKIDTIEHRTAGPGVMYTRIKLPELSVSAYLLTVDLTNRYNKVETFQANNQVGKTEAMTAIYKKQPGAIGGVNGNFWIVSGQNQPKELLGIPHSGSIRNGVMITDPNQWNRGRTTNSQELLNEIGFAVVDRYKKAWVTDMGFDGQVTSKRNGSFPVTQVNRIRKTGELVLFNEYMGKQVTRSNNDGIEVFIKPVDGAHWAINRAVRCKVVRIVKDKGANVIPAGESVLSGSGKAAGFLSKLSEGEVIQLNMGVYTLEGRKRPRIDQMITGNALVMKNGELTIRNTNEAYNSMLYPRTGAGVSADGKKLFLIVIDRGKESKGASTKTMCEILKVAGAWNATSLDGGGSAQMVLNSAIVNNPSDGKERPVANGWMVYQHAPQDKRIARLEFADFNPRVAPSATYTPVIIGYNKYNVLIDSNVTGFSLQCTVGTGSTNTTTFTANGAGTHSMLTVSLNGISVNKKIEFYPDCQTDRQIRFKLPY